MTKLYTATEAAKYLGCHPTTIRSRVENGLLFPSKVEHRSDRVRYWFTKERLDQFTPPTPGKSSRKDSVAAALQGAYRGAAMSDEQTLANYRKWLRARRARQSAGGVSTTR